MWRTLIYFKPEYIGLAEKLRDNYIAHQKEADIIFIDPPYQAGLYERTLSQLGTMPYVTQNTMIILESPVDMDFSFVSDYGFEVRREKEYKTNKHVFIRKNTERNNI